MLFNHRLIDEHNRDVIANRINAIALGAFQAAPVRFYFDLNLADGTGKYLEKSFAYWHLAPPVVKGKSLTPEDWSVNFSLDLDRASGCTLDLRRALESLCSMLAA